MKPTNHYLLAPLIVILFFFLLVGGMTILAVSKHDSNRQSYNRVESKCASIESCNQADDAIHIQMGNYHRCLVNPEYYTRDTVMAIRQRTLDLLYEKRELITDDRFIFWIKKFDRMDSTFVLTERR